MRTTSDSISAAPAAALVADPSTVEPFDAMTSTPRFAEIWLFGLGIWLLLHLADAGHVIGMSDARLLDSVYLSAVTYSTVGFGDVAPSGPIRFLIGTESLLGFVLITWSASFTFLEMEKNWREH